MQFSFTGWKLTSKLSNFIYFADAYHLITKTQSHMHYTSILTLINTQIHITAF